jgi:hypothetical protein
MGYEPIKKPDFLTLLRLLQTKLICTGIIYFVGNIACQRKFIMNKGAVARAKQQRDQAIKSYYENPSICKECDQVIYLKIKNKKADVYRTKKRKFCSLTCSNRHNNKKRIIKCKKCKNAVPRLSSGVLRRNRHCYDCILKGQPSVYKNGVYKRGGGKKPINPINFEICKQTKGDLFKKRKNWQSARSGIAKHARKVYKFYKKPMECADCGYFIKIDICHIKDVSSFDNTTLISKINDPSNLIALCGTHHWEFDNGFLEFVNGKIQNTKKKMISLEMLLNNSCPA